MPSTVPPCFRWSSALRAMLTCGGTQPSIFEAAVQDGMTSSLLELVDTGLVDPDVVVRHAGRSAIPSLWIALAARAAFERGDEAYCVELAARAVRMPGDKILAGLHLSAVWRDAGSRLREQLREVGVERAIDDVEHCG